MPLIPEVEYGNITIADEHTGGHEYERCKAALWSICNVIRKIIETSSDERPLHFTYSHENTAKVLECLYMIGANAKYKDADLTSLVYTGKTNNKYKRNMPGVKYLFELENCGFTFTDIVSLKKDAPKQKLSVKDIAQFTLSYSAGDFTDVIFGLKLFADICLKKSGECFYTGDIRIAFEDAPKLYAPPVDEVFWFLPYEQKKAVLVVHNKLEEIGCVRNLEKEYMLKYTHPRKKRLPFATIYASEQLYFLPESERHHKIAFKFNLRGIGKYIEYLDKCTESIQQAILRTTDCYGCNKACGGIPLTYKGKIYSKCPFSAFRFFDFSEQAIENYIRLLELENNA